MSHITKIAAVENSTAIWEYNPTRTDNHVLGGSLNVISTIRMLAIKVRMSQFQKFTFPCQTHNAPLDSGVWTMYQIFWEYLASLWTPWSHENPFTQQRLMGNSFQYASPGKPPSPSEFPHFFCPIGNTKDTSLAYWVIFDIGGREVWSLHCVTLW